MISPRLDPLLRLESAITPRDHQLLSWLYDHGVLTSAQIAHALFPSADYAQRRLRRLTALQVITRFRPLKPDGGSYPYHYLLDQLGTELVAAQRRDPMPRRDQARTRRLHLLSRANLPHLLGTNQFFTDLAGHQRTHPGTELQRWWPESAFRDRGVFYQDGDDPQIMIAPLPRPDGHGIWVEHDRTVPFFLEYDTGTEKLPILIGKIGRYTAVATLTNRSWPVLFYLPTLRREQALRQRLADTQPLEAIVATTAADHIAGTRLTVADQVWWLHGRQGPRLRLSELPSRDPDHDDS
ncbi:hypothetical protein F4553_001941 [Allocatelliglobosispora scoriae]|uniref:Replication-relaxation n=1 Tax=Allocatelliglobosispora scoriae TaxID=643052 RepID=A0A841BP93_9ACTN|nr:replication-relaxation family protein [Allocatelliglobosispora scoriae]MBB5868562.1 hypothetical protein [Allocatelliglobosispora scoriae]